MNKVIFKIFIIIIGAVLIFAMPQNALAQDLSITYETVPLFTEGDIKPCDVLTKTTTVTNNSTTSTYLFGIAMFDELDPDGLAGILEIRIYNTATGANLYGGPIDPKTLADIYTETQFSNDPATPGTEVYLLTIAPGQTFSIAMEIIFPCDSGNVWQKTSTEFSFGMGWTGSVLGEETKEEGKILGVLSKTGQNILAGLGIGAALILITVKIIKKGSKK
jgi:hypothetical protein